MKLGIKVGKDSTSSSVKATTLLTSLLTKIVYEYEVVTGQEGSPSFAGQSMGYRGGALPHKQFDDYMSVQEKVRLSTRKYISS